MAALSGKQPIARRLPLDRQLVRRIGDFRPRLFGARRLARVAIVSPCDFFEPADCVALGIEARIAEALLEALAKGFPRQRLWRLALAAMSSRKSHPPFDPSRLRCGVHATCPQRLLSGCTHPSLPASRLGRSVRFDLGLTAKACQRNSSPMGSFPMIYPYRTCQGESESRCERSTNMARQPSQGKR